MLGQPCLARRHVRVVARHGAYQGESGAILPFGIGVAAETGKGSAQALTRGGFYQRLSLERAGIQTANGFVEDVRDGDIAPFGGIRPGSRAGVGGLEHLLQKGIDSLRLGRLLPRLFQARGGATLGGTGTIAGSLTVASGATLAPGNNDADTGRTKAGADDEAGYRVERPHVAGNHSHRNEDHRRGNAQRENDDKYEKRCDHDCSVRDPITCVPDLPPVKPSQ